MEDNNYYAIGDIHGYLDILQESMKNVDLEKNPKSKLIFLGDYIDGGPSSAEVLYYIKNLFEKYNGQVIALMGNHEEMFLEWLANPKAYVHYFIEDKDLNTLKTFLQDEDIKNVREQIKNNKNVLEISTRSSRHNKKQA